MIYPRGRGETAMPVIVIVIIVVVGTWLASGSLGAWIALQKARRGGEGFVLGILFGPFGVLVECLLPTLMPTEGPRRDRSGSVSLLPPRSAARGLHRLGDDPLT